MRMIATLVLLALAAARLPGADKPNIVFLLSDDHSYPYVGCYGSPDVRTPALDQLAAEGLKFHRFFTTAPQCVPSRASLLSGRSPVAARMTRFTAPLPADVATFPEVLREKGGYFTGVLGRNYHLDGPNGANEGLVKDLLEKNGLSTFAKRLDYVRPGPDTQVPDLVKDFLDKRPSDKPFCLWVNFSDPHHPWNAPAADRLGPAKIVLPPGWPDLPGLRDQLADYCAEVNRVDRTVGAVLALLRERSLEAGTLLVFAGDNGLALPHGKGSLYDPGCNTPLLVRWPGRTKAGGESRALISGEDLGPTLLAAAGLEAPTGMTGVSFLPLLEGKEFTPRKFLFTERGPHGGATVSVDMASNGYDLSRAVRSDRYKFIYNCTPWIPYGPVDSSGGPGWKQMVEANASGQLAPEFRAAYFTTPRPVYEFYDLQEDPGEMHNLSGREEVAAAERELRVALIEKMMLDSDYLPLPVQPGEGRKKAGQANNSGNPGGGRAATFTRLDADHDGKLSYEEFSVNRQPEEARKWFGLRDANHDGAVDKDEYLPDKPITPKPAAP